MGLIDNGVIKAFWYSSNNIGDAINPFLIKNISKLNVAHTGLDEPHYMCCGSILGNANKNSHVWGAGFHYDHQIIHPEAQIYSVRGLLTKKMVGKDVAVGDPALLLPLFYHRSGDKIRDVGVIPHWSNIYGCASRHGDAYLISPLQNIYDFINDIISCEVVFSESLHGLIIADAYGVPNKWVDIGGDTGGGYFKYNDYYSTTDSADESPSLKMDKNECSVHYYKYNIIDFLKSCPFYGLK